MVIFDTAVSLLKNKFVLLDHGGGIVGESFCHFLRRWCRLGLWSSDCSEVDMEDCLGEKEIVTVVELSVD